MTAYSGGEQIQNYLDPNRPDYGGIVLATSESGSALKRALMKLSADVAGADLMADASIEAAKMGAAGVVDRANAGTFSAGAKAFGQVVGAGISAIPLPGSGGGQDLVPLGLGDGIDKASMTPGIDLRSDRDIFLNPVAGYGSERYGTVMNG
jgi:hypothetical protein